MKPSAFARWIALMLCLSVCFVSLASCGKEPPAEDSTAASGEETAISESLQNTGGTGRLSLPYVKGDSLNPFSAKSLPNQLLSTVLYDSLSTRLTRRFHRSPFSPPPAASAARRCALPSKAALSFPTDLPSPLQMLSIPLKRQRYPRIIGRSSPISAAQKCKTAKLCSL